jgi:gliding motility-associated-like protein
MMKIKLIAICFLSFICCWNKLESQILYSNGGLINIRTGCEIFCNGGIQLDASSQFINNGTITVAKNSTFPVNGSIYMHSNSVTSGNGNYYVEQDWINDANFNGDAGSVYLYGDVEQFITSNNATETVFNNLILSGTGTGQNRKKTLLNANASTGSSGILQINDRELATETNSFSVLNPSNSAVNNDQTFLSEGYVSSILPGALIRITNSTNNYLFPVGSSNGTERYRPVIVTPNSNNTTNYALRFNNYSADNDGFFLAQHEAIIDNANALFYHSIERLSGNSNCDLGILYLPSNDGDWKGQAHWYPADQKWKSIAEEPQNLIGNYTQMTKNAWDFPITSHAHVLYNPTDLISIPTAFTPDGDATNEEWEIPNLDKQYPNNIVRIYNRWGGLLFEHNSTEDGPYLSNQWDGSFNGENLPVGSYYYIIELNNIDKKIIKGIITIIKD